MKRLSQRPARPLFVGLRPEKGHEGLPRHRPALEQESGQEEQGLLSQGLTTVVEAFARRHAEEPHRKVGRKVRR